MKLKAPTINDDADEQGINSRRRWFLAVSHHLNLDQSLIWIHIRGSLTTEEDTIISHHGQTVRVYPSLKCYVFLRPTFDGPEEQLEEWDRIEDLGTCSIFLGLNHPLIGDL